MNFSEIKEIRQGMLLSGIPCLDMLNDALDFAQKYLGTNHLDRHPDYLYVHQMSDKKSMGVEEAALINSKATLKPALSEKQIIIIDGIDSMTEIAQNKILKVLEDCDNTVIVIAIAYSEHVLSTIKSRLIVYEYKHLSATEFVDAMKSYPKLSPYIYYPLSGGCIDSVANLSAYNDMFCAIVRIIDSENYSELLQAMGLLKEKDPTALTNTPYIKNTLHLICACFSEKLMLSFHQKGNLMTIPAKSSSKKYENAIHIIGEHLVKCANTVYSKDNFFFLIVSIIEEMKKDRVGGSDDVTQDTGILNAG